MQVRYYHVDSFTGNVFGGNPAGVCPLESWLPDQKLQRIAAENRLSETAFYVRNRDDGYDLRWFSPQVEVDLCGHATLAAAHVLWRHEGETGETITFVTRSGPLTVSRREERIGMNFPAWPPQAAEFPADVEQAFSVMPASCWKTRDYLFVFESEEQIRALRPDFGRIAQWEEVFGVIVTAPGNEVDFVSRFFAPRSGIPEDPVTGSAHCTLAPYWAERLNRKLLHARQISARGGEVWCELLSDRVLISGTAVTYLTGTIIVENETSAKISV